MYFDVNSYKTLIHSFKTDKEYEYLQSAYISVFSNIKSIVLRNALKKHEKLLNKKNIFDMMYAYQTGIHYAEKYPIITATFCPLDELVNTNRLYQIDAYASLCQTLRERRKSLYMLSEDELQTMERLFEIYSYYNYELIRFAFYQAYQSR